MDDPAPFELTPEAAADARDMCTLALLDAGQREAERDHARARQWRAELAALIEQQHDSA